MPATIDPAAFYWAVWGSGHVELLIPGAAVLDICKSGSNDAAVVKWLPKIHRPPKATPAAVRLALKDAGGWEPEDLQDDATNWKRFVWCAAWTVAEAEEPDCSEPVGGLAGYLGLVPVPNALNRVRALRDPTTGESLHPYSSGNGSLSLVWRGADKNPSGRHVSIIEAHALLKACQQDFDGLPGWTVDESGAGPRFVRQQDPDWRELALEARDQLRTIIRRLRMEHENGSDIGKAWANDAERLVATISAKGGEG